MSVSFSLGGNARSRMFSVRTSTAYFAHRERCFRSIMNTAIGDRERGAKATPRIGAGSARERELVKQARGSPIQRPITVAAGLVR
jgi:hypothetical protein